MILLAAAGFLLCGLAIVTVFVEREADYTLQSLGGEVPANAGTGIDG